MPPKAPKSFSSLSRVVSRVARGSLPPSRGRPYRYEPPKLTALLQPPPHEPLPPPHRHPASKSHGVFVFRSSLVDNGNNNFLKSSGVRADYLLNSIDFPLGPSGRFSNSRNVIDVLGELLRLPDRGLVPPFTDPATRGHTVLHGVNFVSGGSGSLNRTGHDTISMHVESCSFVENASTAMAASSTGCSGALCCSASVGLPSARSPSEVSWDVIRWRWRWGKAESDSHMGLI